MSGITIDIDLSSLDARLARLAHHATHIRPALADIAEEIHNWTQDQFDAQQDPQGRPWQDLKPETWRHKRIPKILTESSRLRRSFTHRITIDELKYGNIKKDGTNAKYAASHQFGRPERNIPARPILGLTDPRIAIIRQILSEWLGA